MTILECHETFCEMGPTAAELLPADVSVKAAAGLDPTAALLTAAASLSGMLDDLAADDVEGLRESVGHFCSLLSAGIVTLEEWLAETHNAIVAVLEWGDDLMARTHAGELN